MSSFRAQADHTSVGHTLPGRWMSRKREQERQFKIVYVNVPSPKRRDRTGKPIPSAIISVLEIAMPMLGYGFHTDDVAFKAMKKLIEDAPAANGMLMSWAGLAETQMEHVDPPLSPYAKCRLEVSLNALKLMDAPIEPHRPFSYAFKLLRRRYCENAVYFMQDIGDRMYWTLDHFRGEASLVARAAYNEWKFFHKKCILAEEAQYIYSVQTNGFYQRPHDTAILLVNLLFSPICLI
ncbi:unnamed protein product [Calypogeia fissa]